MELLEELELEELEDCLPIELELEDCLFIELALRFACISTSETACERPQ
jgi:hypothetical protein